MFKVNNKDTRTVKLKVTSATKTITSQNLLSVAQVKSSVRRKVMLFRRKVVFRSQDIQVFVFLTIPRSTKSVMS